MPGCFARIIHITTTVTITTAIITITSTTIASRPTAEDNNLRAAYLHVLADALTSVLAIVALAAGSVYGWIWLDPMMGIVGALVIARWSWGLIRDSGSVLLDYIPPGEDLPDEIRAAIERDGDRVRRSARVAAWARPPRCHRLAGGRRIPQSPSTYRRKLEHIHELSPRDGRGRAAGGLRGRSIYRALRRG